MLCVSTWLWGESRYGVDHVRKLVAGVRRHLKQPHRFLLVTERERENLVLPDGVERHAIKDPDLCKIKGCFARLRMFDPEWQRRRGMQEGDRIVCIDLDTVITGELDPLFNRPEPFCIMQGGNYQPCKFNGALMMLCAGAHPEIWSRFSLDAAAKVPFHEFPDDQGWLWHELPSAAGWKTGPGHGVYVYAKPGWPNGGDALPDGARLVTFAGRRDPSQFTHLDWVKEHWAA